MSCVVNSDLESQLTAKLAQLASAQETFNSLIDSQIEDYRSDSTEGSERVKRIDVQKFAKVIDLLERQIDSLRRRLSCGGGLTAINVRRGL